VLDALRVELLEEDPFGEITMGVGSAAVLRRVRQLSGSADYAASSIP